MVENNDSLLVALAAENARLRQQLTASQDLLVETAIDAGELHARIEALQTTLAEVRSQWDAWRMKAIGLREPASHTA